jgi:hypothetical protein
VSSAPVSHLFTEEVYTIPPVILVITSRPWENLSEDERSLLAKIIGSVKVSMSSVRVIYRQATTLQELETFNSQRILIFGVSVPIAPYQLVQAQSFTVINADDLAKLDDAKKKSLWLALKSMFTL